MGSPRHSFPSEDRSMIFGEVKSKEKCKECGEWFGDHKEDCSNDSGYCTDCD